MADPLTAAEVETALVRAAATLLFGAAVTLAQRQEAARVVRWLDWIDNPRQRRVTAMRIVPRRDNGRLPMWSQIGRMARMHRHTARSMHAQNLATIAARLAVETADA